MIKVSQYFTGHGMVGVILFIVGNIGSAWCVVDLMRRPAFEAASIGSLVPTFIFGLAALASVPMMLIGREYDMKITEIPKELRRIGS